METSEMKMSASMKIATVICSLVMVVVLFVPIWKIELTAPQYPEGLVLKIWANKLDGNVDVINGLNHYIGMRHLHTEDFVEFTMLPWIIGGYAALGLVVFLANRRKLFNAWFILFLLIAVVSMVDFYRWEYEYGHELNPEAPIQVPGMAYQPPLIGYKKLLNFGAFSIPDTGGWIFVGVGLVLLATWLTNRKRKMAAVAKGMPLLVIFSLLVFPGCDSGPGEIRYGSEACAFCKMTIMEPKFASQCITTKGKRFKFDDSHCLVAFLRNGGVWSNEVKGVYFSDYSGSKEWVPAETGFFLESDNLHGPMGGTVAAFGTQASLQSFREKLGGQIIVWQDINPIKK